MPRRLPPVSAADKEAAEIREAAPKLPEEDRKLAEEQKTCPVGNSALGSMGTPIKVDVGGKPVFICCEGCRKSLLADYESQGGRHGRPGGPGGREADRDVTVPIGLRLFRRAELVRNCRESENPPTTSDDPA